MAKRLQAVVAGHICFDLIPKFPHKEVAFSDLFVPGKLVHIDELAISTGGPVSNTGLAIKRTGIPVTLMAKVGNDFLGKAIMERLKAEGAHRGMIVMDGEHTSYTIALAPPGFDRMFLHFPGANSSFCSQDIDYELVGKVRLFHLGYPPLMRALYQNNGQELAAIFRRVKEMGITTSLDMALPDPTTDAGKVDWTQVLSNVLPWVDLFVPSLEETLFMLSPKDFVAKKEQAGKQEMLPLFRASEVSWMAEELLEMGAAIVLLKGGSLGAYVRTASAERLKQIGKAKPKGVRKWARRELWEPSFQVEHIATATGSGDSAIAGFLAAYLRGYSLEECMRYCCAYGAENLTAPDALSGLKSWEETTQLLERGWRKNDVSIDLQGWEFNPTEQHWIGANDRSRH